MSRTALLQIRLDADTMEECDALFKDPGPDAQAACRMFAAACRRCHGIPPELCADDLFHAEQHLQELSQKAAEMREGQNSSFHELNGE